MQPPLPPETQSSTAHEGRPLVVGVGASAGGLTAFEAFLSAVPAGGNIELAIIFLQHLAPGHDSLLSELIAQRTTLPVVEITDGQLVRPHTVYIAPPGHEIALLRGVLYLLPPESTHHYRLPIDAFFRSLAQDQGERAVGVVLSGTGSDGTLGLRAIKAVGGITVAQTPESTEYDGMPRSAIASGSVDWVLAPETVIPKLISYGDRVNRGTLGPEQDAQALDEGLLKVCVVLRSQTGHDFSLYKRNTLLRRVERRMAVQHVERMTDYVQLLRYSPAEGEALFHDLLIGVTQFFRDPEAYAVLTAHALPVIWNRKKADMPIRIWVPGCSTGEEAYSIAMILLEHRESSAAHTPIQLFATDLDTNAIHHAREGIYPASIAADVSLERLQRFFIQEPDGSAYRVQKILRDTVVFSEHDLVKDPPFSKLDLISCRNVMIYMGGELQKNLIELFHYALKRGGFLFLGPSESVGDAAELFAPCDRAAKLYQRRDESGNLAFPRSSPGLTARRRYAQPQSLARAAHLRTPSARALTEEALLQHHGSVAILVNARGDILYLHGRTGQYLEPTPGEAAMNALRMARGGLRQVLTTSLRQAVTQQVPVARRQVRIESNGNATIADLTVRPVMPQAGSRSEAILFLVVLEERPATTAATPQGTGCVVQPGEASAQIAVLTESLRAKDDYLESANEDLDNANQELQAANEELQSVNEELQATNEEMETAKEELQSINEELTTVNAELQTKVSDLSRSNNDMNNLLAGTGIGTLFVDLQLHILRFTPAVTQIIHLIQSDVGRPVGHIVSNLLCYDRLAEDVQAMLNTLVPKEVEVQSREGPWYLLRMRPYRTLENVIEGAVITFTDITELRAARLAVREQSDLQRLAVVVRDAFDAITVQDLSGAILAWNPGAERLYGWSEAEARTLMLTDRVPSHRHVEELAFLQTLRHQKFLPFCRTERLTKDGRCLRICLTATALINAADAVYAIATTEQADHEHNVTETGPND